MATVYRAISERLTGYYFGEMSPFAQKERVPIAFDEAHLTESSVFLPIRRSHMRRPFDCGPSLSNTSRRPHPFTSYIRKAGTCRPRSAYFSTTPPKGARQIRPAGQNRPFHETPCMATRRGVARSRFKFPCLSVKGAT